MMVREVGDHTQLLAIGEALTDELNRFVPDGVRLTCERWQNHILIFTDTPTGRAGGTGVTDGGLDWRDPGARVAGVAESVLDGVQDDVAEATAGPWPIDDASEGPLPRRWARVEQGRLIFGYGSRQLGDGLDLSDLCDSGPAD